MLKMIRTPEAALGVPSLKCDHRDHGDYFANKFGLLKISEGKIFCKYLFLEIFWLLKISEGKIGESNQLCAVSSVHMKYHIRKD